METDTWRTRLAGGGATHLSSHARHPRPATSDKTRRKSGPSPADSLKESQLAAGPGPSPRRRTSPTRRITTASLEVVVGGALDGCPGEHRVTEESAAARLDAVQRLPEVDHPREPQVVSGPPGDLRDVASAGLVHGDRVRAGLTDPGYCLVDYGWICRLAVAAGQTGQAQVHLHQPVRRARTRWRRARRRGTAAARQGEGERARQRGEPQGRRTP